MKVDMRIKRQTKALILRSCSVAEVRSVPFKLFELNALEVAFKSARWRRLQPMSRIEAPLRTLIFILSSADIKLWSHAYRGANTGSVLKV